MTGVGETSGHHPPGPAADARRRELEALLFDGGTPTAAEIDEFRRLTASPGIPLSSPLGAAEVEAATAPDVPSPAPSAPGSSSSQGPSAPGPSASQGPSAPASTRDRRGRRLLAVGALVVAAGLVGAAVAGLVPHQETTAAHGTAFQDLSGVSPASPSKGGKTVTVDTASGAVVSSSAAAATSTAAASAAAAAALGIEAEQVGARYFAAAQAEGDQPAVLVPGIDPTSTRRVLAEWGQAEGEAKVWIGRGDDHSFCLVMSEGASVASSCTARDQVLASGVRLDIATGDGSVSTTWNLTAGLLEMTPSPAGASVSSTSPTP
ncbi:hypothetical protein [Frondihabitans cladoniiphilus]|uniref:Anti-sigma-K factor rskA n=1 Tax=Frondihabitans cladoniiphilus TaxID=715785 RepID=A0ABP8VJE3_9MICO